MIIEQWSSSLGAALLVSGLAAGKYGLITGLVCLAPTFVGNGVHSTFAKLAGPTTSSWVYTFYLACGMFLSGTVLVALIGEPLEVSIPGLLGGILLSASVTLYINAIMLVGIIWTDMLVASTATLTSFLWGKLYFREPSADIGLALLGLVLLLLGICTLSVLLASRMRTIKAQSGAEAEDTDAGVGKVVLGLTCTALAGVAGGSCFPINKLQPASRQGVSFVWAQGLGVLLAQSAVTLLALGRDTLVAAGVEEEKEEEEQQLESSSESVSELEPSEKQLALVQGRWEASRILHLALAQGAILGCVNVTTTVAGLSPLGMAVAQPVREAGHSISVLIGSLAFREYGQPDMPFMGCALACTVVEILGMIILIVYGSA
jgi:hypothetical protein